MTPVALVRRCIAEAFGSFALGFPALVMGDLAGLWGNLLAPPLGAGLAVFVCRCVGRPGCCKPVPAGI